MYGATGLQIYLFSSVLVKKKKESRGAEKKENETTGKKGHKMHCLSQTVLNYGLWQEPTNQQHPPLPCCAHHGKNYFSRSSFSTCTLRDSYSSTGHLSWLVKPDYAKILYCIC